MGCPVAYHGALPLPANSIFPVFGCASDCTDFSFKHQTKWLSPESALLLFQPLAAGSGIPEIKVYLNGVYIKGLLHIKALVAKLCSVMFSISAGLVAGKEGPFVHGGAIVGGGFGSMGSKFFTNLTRGRIQVKAPRELGGYFRNHAVRCC